MFLLDESHLFMYGGLSEHSGCLDDAWLLDTNNFNWTRLDVPFESRLWHKAVTTKQANGQIFIVGGSTTDVFNEQPTYSTYIIKISLTPDTLKSKCIDAICQNIDQYKAELSREIPTNLEKLILLKNDVGESMIIQQEVKS